MAKTLTPSCRSSLEELTTASIPEVDLPSVSKTSTLGTPNSLALTPLLEFPKSTSWAIMRARSVRVLPFWYGVSLIALRRSSFLTKVLKRKIIVGRELYRIRATLVPCGYSMLKYSQTSMMNSSPRRKSAGLTLPEESSTKAKSTGCWQSKERKWNRMKSVTLATGISLSSILLLFPYSFKLKAVLSYFIIVFLPFFITRSMLYFH